MTAEGETAEPCTVAVGEPVVAGLEGPFPAQPVSRPPATAPAVTSVRRRDSFVLRYSCCSAMVIRRASWGGMPKSGRSMAVNFPADTDNRHTFR